MGAWGVGMPASLLLEEFGSHVRFAFGEIPYMVGSATRTTSWRDVDVRLILDDRDWWVLFPDLLATSTEREWQRDGKWVALTLAFSSLGREVTHLPIDFQIQPRTYANLAYGDPEKHQRVPLLGPPLRWA